MTPRTCDVDACDRPHLARGYCAKHYQRVIKTGSPELRKPTDAERFWAKVNKTETCWLWTGATHVRDYGSFCHDGQMVLTHRYMAEHILGLDIDGLVIDHKCHVRKCVRPSHLQAVTQSENAQNRIGPMPGSKSGIRGVSWQSRRKRVGRSKPRRAASSTTAAGSSTSPRPRPPPSPFAIK